MGFKKWVVKKYDKELAKSLAEECSVDPIVALIASARGYNDATELEQFLSNEPYFQNPRQFKDIEKAAEIVNSAINNDKKIAIYGDYDCDGVTATALMFRYLKSRGADCIYYIPDRFLEGYGMNISAIDDFKKHSIDLIITVDNGISSIEEIKYAKNLGIDVVVTDHHLPASVLPEAKAIVDPHQKDCTSSFKTICGAQVAFMLICVLENKEPEEIFYQYSDILSLAVMADVMPLVDENRIMVKYGVGKLKNSPLVGLSALMSVVGVERDNITAGKLAFMLSPRINAAGRMGSADRAVELLCTDNMMTALNIANEIDAENSNRQQIEKKIFDQAVRIIEENGYEHNRIIVAAGEGWHHGVVGIVASRIAERYSRPTVLISYEGDLASGSGRSIEGFSLFDAIDSCRDLTLKFGGHSQAAGITIPTEKIDEFRTRINEYALSIDYIAPVLNIDCKLNPAALSLDLAEAIKDLEPFGNANQTPLFGLYSVKLERITPIGNNKHLRLLFSKGNCSFQGVLFGVQYDKFCFETGDLLDLAVTVDTNYFNGKYNLSVQVKALRINGIDDEGLFKSLVAYDDYLSGLKSDKSLLLPTREEVAVIYKFICKKPCLEERLKYVFANEIGLGKTLVALKTLDELGLVRNENGVYHSFKTSTKTSLTSSRFYRDLTERE